MSISFARGMACAAALALIWSLALTPAAQSTQNAATAQKTFDTPQQAADALIAAAAVFDLAALDQIFGPYGRDLAVTGDSVQDKNRAEEFAARARERKTVTVDPKNKSRAILYVGNDDWPLPVPIVQKSGKWSFDSRAGLQEILDRRVGSNELDAIEVCRGFVEAQHEYALTKHEGSIVNQYAQRIIATPGKQDGLAWQKADGSWEGPVGEAIARAIQEGYSERTAPYHGYFFKVLRGQGPLAPLGQIDFIVNGAMIGGFALVASPAEYAVTGVQTFIVSQDGVVYEKDLGSNTLNIFRSMDRFNPDRSWIPVTEP